MGCARSEIVDEEVVGVYHCVVRCVRRAFLCGKDSYSGKSFEHRKLWVREKLAKLVQIFAIDVIAYAVMSTHLHSILRNRPDIAQSWSPEEVAYRWRVLFPKRRLKGESEEPTAEEIFAIASDPEKVEEYRRRLSSLSWLNRCLNEYIARRANAEDECTGCFWEGRFKSQRITDTAAILTTAAYVDLNPIRAGRAETPEESDHTSIQDRIYALGSTQTTRQEDWPTVPLVPIAELTQNALSTIDYIRLVDETGRTMKKGKHRIAPDLEDILQRVLVRPENWIDTTLNFKKHFRRIVGTQEHIRDAAARVGKSWFHGIHAAKHAFCSPAGL